MACPHPLTTPPYFTSKIEPHTQQHLVPRPQLVVRRRPHLDFAVQPLEAKRVWSGFIPEHGDGQPGAEATICQRDRGSVRLGDSVVCHVRLVRPLGTIESPQAPVWAQVVPQLPPGAPSAYVAELNDLRELVAHRRAVVTVGGD